MLVRAAHRAAVDMTVRDITIWFRFGDSSRAVVWEGAEFGWLVGGENLVVL